MKESKSLTMGQLFVFTTPKARAMIIAKSGLQRMNKTRLHSSAYSGVDRCRHSILLLRLNHSMILVSDVAGMMSNKPKYHASNYQRFSCNSSNVFPDRMNDRPVISVKRP